MSQSFGYYMSDPLSLSIRPLLHSVSQMSVTVTLKARSRAAAAESAAKNTGFGPSAQFRAISKQTVELKFSKQKARTVGIHVNESACSPVRRYSYWDACASGRLAGV